MQLPHHFNLNNKMTITLNTYLVKVNTGNGSEQRSVGRHSDSNNQPQQESSIGTLWRHAWLQVSRRENVLVKNAQSSVTTALEERISNFEHLKPLVTQQHRAWCSQPPTTPTKSADNSLQSVFHCVQR